MLAGKYACKTMDPGGSRFAEGALEFTPVGDEGVFAVKWVLNLTESSRQQYPDWPPTMIDDAIALSTGERMISVARDNAKCTTPS